ncbi:hypothetical protein HPB47_018677 [Ixodes persulcatus]|uniref:Uncharacterized protein n=1 Tax=Ixodes persulcatus TaxID=34615 RepID=A0AC60QNS0_IXOPE|nr:hypothetical protein HPB47_018677 [Ixodes persulcatus]
MERAVFRAGRRASDAGPGCIMRWLPAALAREARRIRAIADDESTTPCGVMFEESDSVVEKLIEGIRPHPCVYDTRKLEYHCRAELKEQLEKLVNQWNATTKKDSEKKQSTKRKNSMEDKLLKKLRQDLKGRYVLWAPPSS